jgi:hypothetical protein
MKILELKMIDGKVCVVLDPKTIGQGSVKFLDDEDIERFRWAIELAIDRLEEAKAHCGNHKDIDRAITQLEELLNP